MGGVGTAMKALVKQLPKAWARAVLVVPAALVVAATAWAVQDEIPTEIRGCIPNPAGTLRIVDSVDSCVEGETAFYLNVQG